MAHQIPQPFEEISRRVPNQAFQVLFDIGANEGQSCLVYTAAFPEAVIFAFEPAPETFDTLKSNTEAYPNIQTHNIAVGEKDGSLHMHISGHSTMNRVVQDDSPAATEVKVVRLDTFCRERAIPHIDFLKIDTEGHDLSVLHGCGEYLANIDFIQCETSANEYNRFHSSFIEVYKFMSASGFYVYSMGGQTYEWGNGGYPILRRFDPIFINGRIVGPLQNVITR